MRVLITGGGSGIGLTLARRFAADGAEVALCDADPKAVAHAAEALPGAIARTCDVTDAAQMDTFLGEVEAAWGGIDVVCANAGTGGPAGLIEDLDYQAWQDCVAVNLHGAFLTCRWAARLMRAQGSGAIIITSSTSGQWGHPLRSPYCASKWALVGLTKTLAMELGPAGVRVNAICPGAVEGDRMDRVVAMEAAAAGRDEADVRAQYVSGVSMRTWVTADDLADTVLFLASPAASKISGQIIAIDGHTETNAP
ncbi:SDR family oxidoreductase [Roseovarius sp. LXJ103]|uniref:SDR family oxidoreductase n=1 Tax=Roseovarius carneus TaxID=2853164 RepID=UPI000D6135C3|nr:SDR family oxidoreductase [Roseovarius carneus]MBZ8117430.1 SDR family oxidoreductase [Roseovarius carneus]PWE36764.1 3-oxoacyl-[acyl-carrier-protein] reductase [Pelagicola sp. LXJ1103]